MNRKMSLYQFSKAVFALTGDPSIKPTGIQDQAQLEQAIQESEALSISDSFGDLYIVRDRYKLLSDLRNPKSYLWDVLDNFDAPVLLPDDVLTGKQSVYMAFSIRSDDNESFDKWIELLRRREISTFEHDGTTVLLSPLSAFIQ